MVTTSVGRTDGYGKFSTVEVNGWNKKQIASISGYKLDVWASRNLSNSKSKSIDKDSSIEILQIIE
jgi:hypothetical protein